MMNRFNSTFKIKPGPTLTRTRAGRKRGKLRSVRKVRANSEAWMKAKLTIKFSEFIRRRDPFCYCGRSTTECGHFYSRAVPSTEYDEDNCLGSCSDCNQKHEHNKEPMRAAILARIGEERFAELERRAWDHSKLTFGELEDLLERYQVKARQNES